MFKILREVKNLLIPSQGALGYWLGSPPIGIIAGSSSCNKTNKNGRGYAKPWSEWDNGKIKILEWKKDCQPPGPNEPKLMSYLGNLAWNGVMFPLAMLSWKVVSNTCLDGDWKSVKVVVNIHS
ncbi:hypothetical protein GIB67_030299 [Kingdonia uniflora]|uniref:Uncharacterized protein n=1 Tax=Kingdonia uniflora TaxID=39325 RepID=A0A7J7M6V9_9MAGN|nr:hypothetical protein GIB67_030299 [Kingdonia uniflora]